MTSSPLVVVRVCRSKSEAQLCLQQLVQAKIQAETSPDIYTELDVVAAGAEIECHILVPQEDAERAAAVFDARPATPDHQDQEPTDPPLDVGQRRAWWWELSIVLLITCIPFFFELPLFIEGPQVMDGWFLLGDLTYSLGIILLLAYLVWKDQGTLASLGLKDISWGRELLLSPVILGIAWGTDWCADYLVIVLDLPGWQLRTFEVTDDSLTRSVLPLSLLVSAFYEEILFRGYLWSRLSRLTAQPTVSLVLVSTLFALTHLYGPTGTLYVGMFGLVFGFLFWVFRKLPRLIIAHWAFNMLIEFGDFS